MISASEAFALIQSRAVPLPPVVLPLEVLGGKVLAEDVLAPAGMPPFAQAGMDGYAVAWRATGPEATRGGASGPEATRDGAPGLTIRGEVPAGHAPTFVVAPGEAVRIFTGAMLPPGTDTVVMQERVRVEGDRLYIEDPALTKGAYVRAPGSDIAAGALALPKGTLLGPASIGLLAGLGLDQALVHPKPRVNLITTGNELQVPGRPLPPGQVYESNSFALRAALGKVTYYTAPDEPEALKKIIAEALAFTDVLLLTGGVSVGDYDIVGEALAACGVTRVFHGVRQRPGKPFYFGMRDQQLVFGLPGNPSSVLTCFYLYVLPALERLGGRMESAPVRLPLAEPYHKAPGLTHFLKGRADATHATPLSAQESYRMSSYALANCLIRLPEEGSDFAPGDLVDVYRLPYL